MLRRTKKLIEIKQNGEYTATFERINNDQNGNGRYNASLWKNGYFYGNWNIKNTDINYIFSYLIKMVEENN